VTMRWAWWSSLSTVAVASVLGMMVSKPAGCRLLVQGKCGYLVALSAAAAELVDGPPIALLRCAQARPPGARGRQPGSAHPCRGRADLPGGGLKAEIQAPAPHDLRRTWIGALLDLGVDLATVQKMAGHASAETTRGSSTPDTAGLTAPRAMAKLGSQALGSGSSPRKTAAWRRANSSKLVGRCPNTV
jgi:hypothetical protein